MLQRSGLRFGYLNLLVPMPDSYECVSTSARVSFKWDENFI